VTDDEKLTRIRAILADPFGVYPDLDEKERKVARLASRGHTLEEVGVALGISPNTAGSIVKRLTLKTGLTKTAMTTAVFKMLEKVLAAK
jgi:DNA-binding CsgD family transcriptional regulator